MKHPTKTNTTIVLFSFFILLSGFIITKTFNAKLHYPIFFAATLLLPMLNFFSKNSIQIGVYIFFSLVVATYQYIFISVNEFFILTLSSFLVIPLFFSKKIIYISQYQVFKILSFFTIFYFVGTILQIIGADSTFLKLDRYYVGDVPYERYGSFAGGTLALGLAGTLTSIYAFYYYINRKNAITFIILLCSIAVVFLAYSRRFYVLLVLILIFQLSALGKPLKIKSRSTLIFVSVIIIGISLYMSNIAGISRLLDRAISITDFEGDESNVGRVIQWTNTFNDFKNNIWSGIGLGYTGVVGRSDLDFQSLNSAESYYLKILTETGVLYGAFYIIFCFYLLYKVFELKKVKAISASIVLFYLIESFVGDSLSSVFSSAIYWINVGMLLNPSSTEVLSNIKKK